MLLERGRRQNDGWALGGSGGHGWEGSRKAKRGRGQILIFNIWYFGGGL
jgi:hypothetical protein